MYKLIFILGILSLPPPEEDKTLQKPKSLSMRSLGSRTSIEKRNAISHPDLSQKQIEMSGEISKYKWWEPQEFNLGSSINIFNEPEGYTNDINLKESAKYNEISETDKNEPKGLLKKFVDLFDLTLLTDPIFVNILVGLSLAGCVETNFSLLLPIILKDMLEFDTSQIAIIMSVIGFSDTIFRLASPFIGEWCHKPPRVMYLISLTLIILVRTCKYFLFIPYHLSCLSMISKLISIFKYTIAVYTISRNK